MTPEEKAAARAKLAELGVRENKSTDSTVTFFRTPEAAEAMRKQLGDLAETTPPPPPPPRPLAPTRKPLLP